MMEDNVDFRVLAHVAVERQWFLRMRRLLDTCDRSTKLQVVIENDLCSRWWRYRGFSESFRHIFAAERVSSSKL